MQRFFPASEELPLRVSRTSKTLLARAPVSKAQAQTARPTPPRRPAPPPPLAYDTIPQLRLVLRTGHQYDGGRMPTPKRVMPWLTLSVAQGNAVQIGGLL